MTRYDEPSASDGKGGPHPLAGVPQEALDACVEELKSVGYTNASHQLVLAIDDDEIEAVAHAILLAGLIEITKGP